MYPYNISVATRAEKLIGGEEQLKSVYSRLSDECFMLTFKKKSMGRWWQLVSQISQSDGPTYDQDTSG